MRISVVIPVYNASKTIQETLNSVLYQTLRPDEILVMDDGSTDDTSSLLEAYTPRITIFRQGNRGVAAARNALCTRVTGDFIAFLDSDDVWHPRYLEQQCQAYEEHPDVVACFSGHVAFYGYGSYEWPRRDIDREMTPQVLSPLLFLQSLEVKSGYFFPSFLCVPKTVLADIGRDPFPENLSGVDDGYFCCRLALLGHVVFTPDTLVAYRVHKDSISQNILKMCGLAIRCYEALERHYEAQRGTKGLSGNK